MNKLKILLLIIFLFVLNPVKIQASITSPKKGVAGFIYPNPQVSTPPALNKIGASWIYDWNAELYGLNVPGFVPMLRYGSTNWEQNIVNITNTHKGLYWLIGNEPDSAGSTDSDGKRADWETLKSTYIEFAKTIKQHDSTSKLIIGGFLTTSENDTTKPAYNMSRLLNDSLKANNITVTGWHIHLYNCCILDTFTGSLAKWKEWQNRVLGGGETWVTEFGNLNAANPDWMTQTVNFMEQSPDVDRYAWFSLPTYTNFAGGLILPDNSSLSYLGQIYSTLPTNGQTHIETQKGWNKISLTATYNNIFTNCSVSSKRGNFWKIFKNNFGPGQPYYTKCF